MKIVLIRHGFSEGNEKFLLAGWTDVALTATGRAELLEIKKNTEFPETDEYICSDLKRCKETFEILFPDKVPIYNKNFREINFGDYDGYSPEQVDIKNYLDRWANNEDISNNETYDDFRERIYNELKVLLQNLKLEGKESATIVTHSGVIKILIQNVLKFENKDFFTGEIKNGGGGILEVDLDSNSELTFLSFEPF